MYNDRDIDTVIERLIFTLKESYSVIPNSRYRKHLKLYWTPELNNLKKEKVKCYKQWVAEGRPREQDHLSLLNHKTAKKQFAQEMKRLDRSYESEQLQNVMGSLGLDHRYFWSALRRVRTPHNSKSLAIRNSLEKVVHNLDDVLEVWRLHFSNLSTPKDDPTLDTAHFDKVNNFVADLNEKCDSDRFLKDPFTLSEVKSAIKKLHKRKAPGVDGITTEHILYAGDIMVSNLLLFFNLIISREYVPENLRRGLQVPLFKGKNLCSLDVK